MNYQHTHQIQQIYQFKQSNILEYISLAETSFYQNSPASNKNPIHFQLLSQYITKLINSFIYASERLNKERKTDIPYNSYTIVNGKMASALFTCDMREFVYVVRYQMHQKYFDKFPIQSFYNIQHGQGIFALPGMVNSQFKNKGILQQHILIRNSIFLGNGIKLGKEWSINSIPQSAVKQLDSHQSISSQDDPEQQINLVRADFNYKIRPSL